MRGPLNSFKHSNRIRMKKKFTLLLTASILALTLFSFKENSAPAQYLAGYHARMDVLKASEQGLLQTIAQADLEDSTSLQAVRDALSAARMKMKGVDFWTRYLDPVAYKKLNGPLPVEWETEVFEKFEKPYKRDGAGLTLATIYLDEPHPSKTILTALIDSAVAATNAYTADTVTRELGSYHHFLLCNRLYLLNLAAIYTTGFECPDTARILPELHAMMNDVRSIYGLYNESYPTNAVTGEYLALYDRAIAFVQAQPKAYSAFDHFTFLKDYVNPLYTLNAMMVRQYNVVSHSLVDYSMNKAATTIFSKNLYRGQNVKGIFTRIKDSAKLADIEHIGKLLFYDPILSANNQRSCVSCHKPGQFFTDTLANTALAFNHRDFLARNTPSLINADFNHLIMMDGTHFSLQHQTRGVVMNPLEMGSIEADAVRKVMSCAEYKNAFTKLLAYTPQEPEVSFEHIASALTMYYSKFSGASAPFDEAMNAGLPLNAAAKKGFNVFMSKAQCATCHFVPQFNGVKPPYVGSEFEVLGVPADGGYRSLGTDSGRYAVNAAPEMLHAFRTGTIRNAARTAPYMHNGVFRTIREVIDFYDCGGGAGNGLIVANQTLSADPLGLSEDEKSALTAFISSLTEAVQHEGPPARLPRSNTMALNHRRVGGIY